MKKICFFISSISLPGGTERVCTEIATQLSKLGYQVTILSMFGSKPFFELNSAVNLVSVFEEKRNLKPILPYVVLRLRTKITRISPEVLINVDSALFLYSHTALIGLGIKKVVWEHFNFNASLNASVRVFARRLAAKYSDAIITLTNKDKTTWTTRLTCKVPVFTINNPSPFTPSKNKCDNGAQTVISVGRLTSQKGFDRLLDAWQIVKTRLASNDWDLKIIGSGESKQDLEQRINRLNISSSVKLLPQTNDIQQYYKQASIYCMASRFEGFPMVLLEAQAFGLPLVSYDCETGPSEIINSENGLLVRNGDKYALANALVRLMTSEKERQTMSAKSLKNSENYSIDVIIRNWTQLFEVHLV
jgi:glycosyltransferase involved in cell wall biosynthesis